MSDRVTLAGGKNRPSLVETRTDEQRIKDLRKNLANGLWIMPDDIRLLLNLYDASVLESAEVENEATIKALDLNDEALDLRAEVVRLRAENEQFRTIYEMENRSQTVTVEQFIPPPGEAPEPLPVASEPLPDTDQHRMDDDGAAVAHPDAPASVAPLTDDDIPF